VIDRAPPDPFYHSDLSENPGAGASRRSVPNIEEVAAAVAHQGDVLVIRLEDCDLFEQIYLFSRAWRVVGQHGAGLAHMLWAPPGAALVEILPNAQALPIESLPNVRYFRGICDTLGLGWRPVTQSDDHAPVDAATAAQALADCA
jgi:capsular polysaccharide biosynthesis protein